MPEQPFNARVPAGKRPTAPQPIWAPNPAVPPAARILAYAFGILTLLTVMISINYTRPADLPVVPDKWQTYNTENFSIPYPDGWEMKDHKTTGQQQVIFYQAPDPYIRINAICLSNRYPIDAESVEKLKLQLEAHLDKEYNDYKKGDSVNDPGATMGAVGAMGNWNMFSGRLDDEAKHRITGAWALKVQGTRVLYIEAISAENGWYDMAKIFSSVCSSATLTADSINPGYGYMNQNPSAYPNTDPNANPGTEEAPPQ